MPRSLSQQLHPASEAQLPTSPLDSFTSNDLCLDLCPTPVSTPVPNTHCSFVPVNELNFQMQVVVLIMVGLGCMNHGMMARCVDQLHYMIQPL